MKKSEFYDTAVCALRCMATYMRKMNSSMCSIADDEHRAVESQKALHTYWRERGDAEQARLEANLENDKHVFANNRMNEAYQEEARKREYAKWKEEDAMHEAPPSEEMVNLLTSMRAICARGGKDTSWGLLDQSIAKLGIGSVTARTYRVIPLPEHSDTGDGQDVPDELRG
jgi:hypothetical protein